MSTAQRPSHLPTEPTALHDALPLGPGATQWSVWSTTVRLIVSEPAALAPARMIVKEHLAAVEKACSRFRPDAEIHRLYRAGGRTIKISPLLAELVAASLLAAERTDGDVDPTVAGALNALGYTKDLSLLPVCGSTVRVRVRAVPGWHTIRLEGRRLTVPAGVSLDLGATAKAFAADRAAALVAAHLGVGVLVSLGGDIATAGPAPDGGWRVLVQDRTGEPAANIALPAGAALATSSTLSRTWRRGDDVLHHIVDPRTGNPADPVWRTASVAAFSCVEANTYSTAALVRGLPARSWLRELGVPARLVTAGGAVITLGSWPAEVAGAA